MVIDFCVFNAFDCLCSNLAQTQYFGYRIKLFQGQQTHKLELSLIVLYNSLSPNCHKKYGYIRNLKFLGLASQNFVMHIYTS